CGRRLLSADALSQWSSERLAAAREPQSLPSRRFCGCQRSGDLHARAALVSCRAGEVIDDLVDDPTPVGIVKLRLPRDSQLVDDADEGTRSHRWPDGENTHADDPSIGLG